LIVTIEKLDLSGPSSNGRDSQILVTPNGAPSARGNAPAHRVPLLVVARVIEGIERHDAELSLLLACLNDGFAAMVSLRALQVPLASLASPQCGTRPKVASVQFGTKVLSSTVAVRPG